MKHPDVDIDVTAALDRTRYGIRAIKYDESSQRILPHPGIYFMDSGMTVDAETGDAAIDYEHAERLGFFKIDLLNNSVYASFANKQEVLQTLALEPDWSKLEDANYVSRMPHLAKHAELVLQVKPTSIDSLADVLALIRPGKKSLISEYLAHPEATRKILYERTEDGNYFKKSHAYAYAAMLICHMNKQDCSHLVTL